MYDYIDSDLGGYGLYYGTTMAATGLVIPALPQAGVPFDAPTPAGQRAAAAFREAIAGTAYYREYFGHPDRPVPAAVALEYARAACLCQLQTDDAPDRPLLRDVFCYGGDPEEAALRRATLRFFLDLSAGTDGVRIDQETFRRLIYFRDLGDGLRYVPRAEVARTARRWRLYQAREYYSLALNRLWALLTAWGAERSAAGAVSVPVADWWDWLDSALDFGPVGREIGTGDPGISSSVPLADLVDWITATAGTGADVDDIWPRDSALTEDRLSSWRAASPDDPALAAAMIALLLLIRERVGRPARQIQIGEDMDILAAGGAERLAMTRFFDRARRAITSGATIGDFARSLVLDFVIRQHERVAMSKLPDDTFRFRRDGDRLRFSTLRAEAGFNDSRFTGGPPAGADLAARIDAVTTAVADFEASFADGVREGQLRSTLDGLLASAAAATHLTAPIVFDPAAVADELDRVASLLLSTPSAHVSGTQRAQIARAWQIAALLLRYDAAVRAVSGDAPALLHAAKRQAEVLLAEASSTDGVAHRAGLIAFLTAVEGLADPGAAQAAWQRLAWTPPPVSLVGTSLLPRRFGPPPAEPEPEEPPRAVCVATMRGVPVTDVLVVRARELYHLGMTIRLVSVPEWAERCIVEPVTMLGRDALALPRYEFSLSDAAADEFGITLTAEGPLHCGVDQPIRGPALDCPMQVRLAGDGHEQAIEVAGCRRLRLRPFDPSRDKLTEHEQTDGRLLAMFATLDSPEYDTEDARAFCRLFAACVRAAQVIMFQKTFMRGSKVSEAEFHDELERLLRADPELEGRLTRRDAVAGGFDDLLHDDVIAELKVSRGAPVTIDHCTRYLGQPAQYGVGRGSQLSVLIVFDHGRKEAPPGVIDNYIDWLRPRLHGRDDPRYPSLVGVLIINTNLPIPSAWRHRIDTEPVTSRPQYGEPGFGPESPSSATPVDTIGTRSGQTSSHRAASRANRTPATATRIKNPQVRGTTDGCAARDLNPEPAD